MRIDLTVPGLQRSGHEKELPRARHGEVVYAKNASLDRHRAA